MLSKTPSFLNKLSPSKGTWSSSGEGPEAVPSNPQTPSRLIVRQGHKKPVLPQKHPLVQGFRECQTSVLEKAGSAMQKTVL